MKIAIAQHNPIIGDLNCNTAKMTRFAADAKRQGCDLIVFPELSVCGYPPRDLLERRDFVDANIAAFNRLVASIRGIGVICGYVAQNPANEGNSLYNAGALFEDGTVLHTVYKRLLPTYDVFDERRYFEPGTACNSFAYKDWRIGLTVCEDAWNDKDIFSKRIYPLDPVDLLVRDGAEAIINISASPFFAGKREFRWHMLEAIAKKYHIPVIFANQVGGNDALVFDGMSCAFDAHGAMLARAEDFDEDMIVLDFKANTGWVHDVSVSTTASVHKALVTGTRDYVTKCGFSRVVIGLSGGIDSAVTAAIAVKALGPENVKTIFMPSRYTAQDNFEDTRALANNLGVFLSVVSIDSIFDAFLDGLSPVFATDAAAPGVTEQNIQARIRGTLLMAISNREGSLLLSTGNKSELAVGYCTLYGDMNGGLAVISDVPKTVVYQLAEWINQESPVIPARIIEKAPSAELKPDQTDQDDLPPYELLDPILKGYIEAFQGIEELVAAGHDRAQVQDIIARVERNEYKRQQAAPGIKITSKAFGYGRRYPLAKRFVPAGEG
jgi:NAD+ synthase (glutamine-hydrolysing)